MPSEDRLALVSGAEEPDQQDDDDDDSPLPAASSYRPALTSAPPPAAPAPSSPSAAGHPPLPWLFSIAFRRPALPAGAGRLTLLSALLVALSALLLVQLALLRDASRAADVGAYPAAVALSLVAVAMAVPPAAVALWRGGRPAPPGRLSAAAAICSVGSLLVLAGRHQNRLGCNVQDPLVAVVIVFAFMGHLLTASEVRLRSTIAQVIVCLGVFIGVSYQACNKYRCHGDDRSGSWRRAGVAARGQHVLWVAVGASGLAMVCGAAMLLESHFHGKRRNGKGAPSSWWDDMASTALMTTASLITVGLLFWVDLIPGVGESESAADLGRGLLDAFSAMSAHFPHYRRACLLISATSVALTLVAVRLLSARRPTFQLATLVTLGVLVSELWWSVSRIDGAGGWTPHVRVTGEAIMALVGGLLMVGGLVSWLSFAEKENKGLELAVCEFEVYKVQQSGGLAATKYRWPLPEMA